MPAKDGRAVEGEVERRGELRRGVAEEADLRTGRALGKFRERRGVEKKWFWGSPREEKIIEKQGKASGGKRSGNEGEGGGQRIFGSARSGSEVGKRLNDWGMGNWG